MSTTAHVEHERSGVTVHVPLRFERHGGRKRIIVDLQAPAPVSKRTGQGHATILKALGRAHRWQGMLESGVYSSISDLADAEKINHSYVRRVLRLTLLSPSNIERLLNGHIDPSLRLHTVLRCGLTVWAEQRLNEL